MPNLQPKSNNRNPRNSLTLGLLVAGGFLLYLFAFLRQDSVLGFVDGDNQPMSRFVDVLQLLWIEDLVASMAGSGQLPVGVLDRLPILLAALAWCTAAWWIALPIVRLAVDGTKCGRLELHCLATLSGLSILATATLLLGVLGAIGSRWPLLCVVGLLAAAAAVAGRRLAPASSVTKPQLQPLPNSGVQPGNVVSAWLQRLVPAGCIVLAAFYVWGSLMTPWEFDVVEYHLQAPKEFYQDGIIAFNRHNVYSNMPLGAEMHTLAVMVLSGGQDGWWRGGLVGKTIIGLHALLASALLGGFIARRIGRWGGWAAASLLLAAPGNAHVSMAGLIDMVLASYLLASLVVFTLVRQNLKNRVNIWAGVFLVSQLAGAAAACKYTGLPFVLVPLLFGLASVFVRTWRPSHRGHPVSMAATAVVAGLSVTCLPWYFKNWWQSGNPFFPLAYSWFGGDGISAAQAQQWQLAHRVPNAGGGEGPFSLRAWGDAWEQVFLKSEFLHPSLIFLVVCGILVAWYFPQRFPTKWLWGWLTTAAWILGIWWFATHRLDRFWLPVLPIWCAIAAVGATWIAIRLSASMAAILLLIGMVYGGLVSVSGAISDHRFFVSLAALRKDVGTPEVPGRLPAATGWANEALREQNAKLLLIGEARVYDFRMPIVFATCFNTNPGETWLRGKTPEQQRAALHAAGITHILINWREIRRYRAPGNYGFSDWPQRGDVEQWISQGVAVPVPIAWEDEDVEILQVLP